MQSTRAPRVLVISGEPIGAKRAGPAVRALAMTQQISRVAETRILSTAMLEETHIEGLKVYSRRDVRRQVQWADVIVFQGYFLTEFPWVVKRGKILVADLYAPFHLEHLLENQLLESSNSESEYFQTVASLNWQLRHADYFLAASSAQRDFWLGHLAAMGRINPRTLQAGTDLTQLIDVVPFGIDSNAPSPDGLLLREQIKASAQDKIVIWGGGIYDWFDPLSLIEAMGLLRDSNPEIKLFFMAVKHPNSSVAESPIIEETINRSKALGLYGKTVFFNEEWIPFELRAAYLKDADLGISIHGSHIETAYSFRTRMLDYIWSGLPIVASEGDSFAELIDHDQLGVIVPVGDSAAIAQAIRRVLLEPGMYEHYSTNVATAQTKLHWDVALEPLVNFCRVPHRAADFQLNHTGALRKPHKQRPWLTLIKRTYRESGLIGLLNKVVHKIRG